MLAARRDCVAVDARQVLGEEAWNAAYAARRALSAAEAIAEALPTVRDGDS
jgi:hypothetical protein